MKPIEPGCLAWFVGGTRQDNGEFIPGQEVTIHRRWPHHTEPCARCGTAGAWDPGEGYAWIACDCELIRIDGDPDEIKQEEADDCTA